MTIDFSKDLWRKLGKSKAYRTQFVSAQARRAFAFQLRAIMKKRGLSQEKLAELSGLTQGVISRAADPNYGKLTITVIVKIANGLDMAYLGTLVPFSDVAKWVTNLSEDAVQVATFEEEYQSVISPLIGGGGLGRIPLELEMHYPVLPSGSLRDNSGAALEALSTVQQSAQVQ